MKGLPQIVLVMMAVCLLAACGPSYTPPPDWLKHENHTFKFTVYYPQGWKLSNQGSPELIFYISSPKLSEYDYVQENVNLISQVVAPETDLATYEQELEKKANSQLQNIKKISSTEMEFKGHPAINSVYEAVVNDVRVKWNQYVWLQDDRVYLLTYSADISQYETYKGLATEIIESLQFY